MTRLGLKATLRQAQGDGVRQARLGLEATLRQAQGDGIRRACRGARRVFWCYCDMTIFDVLVIDIGKFGRSGTAAKRNG